MTDWQPKPGDTVLVVNPNRYIIADYEKPLIGENVIFRAAVKMCTDDETVEDVDAAVVEHDLCGYVIRMDMLAHPVDPRRAVLEKVFNGGISAYIATGATGSEAFEDAKEQLIKFAIEKLDNLPPF